MDNKIAEYIEYINSRILAHIDYNKLHRSYETDMVYAKGILNELHEAMVKCYGSEILDRHDGDDGFVLIPGVIQSRAHKQNLCLALLHLDLSSSGEHWGTEFICKYGVISQNSTDSESNSDKYLKAVEKYLASTYIPYDYGYTAIIPHDHHVRKDMLPERLLSVLEDFRNHRAVLKVEDERPSAVEKLNSAKSLTAAKESKATAPPVKGDDAI